MAISDLHVEVPENRALVEQLRPVHANDWLIVSGDVGDFMDDIEWGLRTLSQQFERVIWVPGNHELWTRSDDPDQVRGEDRYRYIVNFCQRHGISTPDDPFSVWDGPDGPVVIAPLFTLYDYSFGRNVGVNKRESLARADKAGVVCSDEFVLFTKPYPSLEAWSEQRVAVTERRLAQIDGDMPTVLVSHFPLIVELTRPLMFPEFAQWCGTVHTADWHRRFRAAAVVYGHLHIPRTTLHDDVPFHEVSLGYPRQWRQTRGTRPRKILTQAGSA